MNSNVFVHKSVLLIWINLTQNHRHYNVQVVSVIFALHQYRDRYLKKKQKEVFFFCCLLLNLFLCIKLKQLFFFSSNSDAVNYKEKKEKEDFNFVLICVSEFYSFIFLCSICYPSCVLFVFLNAIDQLLYRLFLNTLLVSVILFNKKKWMCVCVKEWTNCYLCLFFPSLLIIEYLLWRYIQYFSLILIVFSLFFCLMLIISLMILYINLWLCSLSIFLVVFFSASWKIIRIKIKERFR